MKKQNNCLNFFKGLACIFVVAIHMRFPVDYIDGPIQSAARFAVPFFFMVSGYYCFNEDKTIELSKLPKKVKHIAILCLGSFIFWFLFILITQVDGGLTGIGEWLLTLVSFESLYQFILFNVDPFIQILWFLFALLYCYILFYIFARLNAVRILKFLILPLLIAHFTMGNICNGLLDFSIPGYYYRNCWLMGMPLFMLGYVIHEYRQSILKKANSNVALIAIIAGGILAVCEWLIVGGRQQMYIGSVITASAMIIYSQWHEENYVIKSVAIIGQKYSMLIYVLHYCIGICFDYIMAWIGIADNFIFSCFRPSIVIILSIISSVIVLYIWQKLSAIVNKIKKILNLSEP